MYLGDEIKRKAKKLKLAGKEVREHATGVLHSWTAAATLRDEFPELSDAVLQAIGRHTCGAVGMSDLDMVGFVADIIEPGRDFPDIEGLRAAVGEVCLEELFYRTYKANFMYLLSADMVVASPSLDVYNSLVVERKERLEAERAACDAPAGDEASEAQLLAVEIARREQLAREATELPADQIEPYAQQLIFDRDPMMSWVEIPSIDVSMPIYHGTSEEVLMAGVGHLVEATPIPLK